MKAASIENILFIPSQILTIGGIAYKKVKHLFYKLLNGEVTFTGYLRTEEAFRELFISFYDVEQVVPIGELKGWLLNIREGYSKKFQNL